MSSEILIISLFFSRSLQINSIKIISKLFLNNALFWNKLGIYKLCLKIENFHFLLSLRGGVCGGSTNSQWLLMAKWLWTVQIQVSCNFHILWLLNGEGQNLSYNKQLKNRSFLTSSTTGYDVIISAEKSTSFYFSF